MDLTTLATVKAYLGVPNTASDAVLQTLITAYSGATEGYISRLLSQASYNEWRDGNGGDQIMLINYPVTAVASVTVYPLTTSYVPVTDPLSNGYRQFDVSRGDGRLIVLTQACFTRGRRNVNIQYTAGYVNTAAVPADLQEAVCELVSLSFKRRDWIGKKSQALAGETISYDTAALPEPIAMTLQRYRDPVLPT